MDEVKHESSGENSKPDKSENSKPDKLESIRKNPWVVSTFVLAILIIVLLVAGSSGITGKVVSGEKAGQAILDFALDQGLDAEVLSVEKQGSFYEVILSIEGNELPVYVTKDGKYFTSSLIPLELEEEPEPNGGSTTTDVPKSDKPVVDLFIMSHCPYGTQAEKGIIPAVELLGENIDFNLRFVYYAMHPSAGEVEEQLRQYCIQKEQESKLLDYLKCFLQAGDSNSCLTEAKIDKTKLNSCFTSADKQFEITKNKDDTSLWLNGRYPLFNIDKELNEQYSIGGSPTLVINGVQVSSARDPASYLNAICNAFEVAPSECSVQLSSTAYSAGFGYTAGTSTTAQC